MVTASLPAETTGEYGLDTAGAAPARPRFDPFRVLSPAEREAERHAYHEHLRRRDGEIDWEGWTLPVREARMRELREQDICWQGKLNRDAFYRLLHRVDKPETDTATLWAALVALANEGERFGVEMERRTLQNEGAAADPVMVYHVLQEDYHTDLLLEACRTVGLEGVTMGAPRFAHRWIIRAMSYCPNAFRYSLILIGEAIGTVVLQLLHDRCDLFADTPEAEARLRSIFSEIVDDERLHSIHCRSRLGRVGLGFARALIPISAWAVEYAYPQIVDLGMDRHQLAAAVHAGVEIPAGSDWIRPDPLPAS